MPGSVFSKSFAFKMEVEKEPWKNGGKNSKKKLSSSHIQPDSEKKVTDPSLNWNIFQYYTYGGNTTVRYVLYMYYYLREIVYRINT